MLQFSIIQEVNFSRGIDQNSSPPTLQEGFVEDAIDVDIIDMSLQKRTGYERLAGDVPIVVQYVSVASGVMTLTLDPSIDLSTVPVGPIWVQGRIADDTGTYHTVDEFHTTFVVPDFYTLTPGSNLTLAVDLAVDLGLSSIDSLIGASIDSESIYLGEIVINPSTMAASVNYSTTTADELKFLTPITAGLNYGSPEFSSGSALLQGSAVTIPTSTHNLATTILPLFYTMESASIYRNILPDQMEIAVNGDITVRFSPSSSDKFKFFAMEGSFIEGVAVTGTTSTTAVIPDAQSPYLIAACYVEDLTVPSSPVYRLVIPDSIAYTGTSHEVTFKHNVAAELGNYRVVYIYCKTSSNRLTVTGSTVPDTTLTSAASLAISGIDQDSLVRTKSKVVYVGEYTEKGEALMSTGGMLFRTFDPNVVIPVVGTGRVSADLVIGPMFSKTPNGRTLGNISSMSTTIAGFLPVQSFVWQSGNIYRVTLSADAWTISAGSLSSVLTGRQLSIQGCLGSKFDGNYTISTASTLGLDSFYIDIVVPSTTGSRWNELDSGALAACFEDELIFLTGVNISAEIGDTIILSPTVTGTVSAITPTLVLQGVESVIKLYAGQKVGVDAERMVIDLASNTTFLVGDIVTSGDVKTRITAIDGNTLTLREPVVVTAGLVTLVVPQRWQMVLVPDVFLGVKPFPVSEVVTGMPSQGNIFFNNAIKYDGDEVYVSGLPRSQLHIALMIEEGATSSIPVTSVQVPYTAVSGNEAEVLVNDLHNLKEGDLVLIRKTTGSVVNVDPSDMYQVTGFKETSPYKVIVDRPLPVVAGGSTYELSTFVQYRYFARLALLDRVGNLSVSSSLGGSDLEIRLTKSSAVHLRCWYLPRYTEMIDYNNTVIQVFRRREVATDIGPYCLAGVLPLSERVASATDYIDFTDASPNAVVELTDNIDQIVDPITGGIGTNRYRQPVAELLALANNQLIVGDYFGENYASITIDGTASYSAYQTKEFLVTHTTGSVAYYICASTDSQVVARAVVVASTSFTLEVTSTIGITAGDVIFIGRDSALTVADNTTLLGWWIVDEVVDTTHLKVLWSGAPASLSAADTINLKAWHKAGKVPLVDDLKYMNNGQSMRKSDSDKLGLPLHLSQAINATLGYIGIYAHGGLDFPSGVLELTGEEAVSITVPSVSGARIYCNGSLDTATAINKITKYSARTAMSIKKSPEVFEDIEATNSTDLPLIQDFNPDDGDVVTGVTPFFAQATFGAAQQSAVLLVMKSRSAYVIDLQGKYTGVADYYKQVDTRGIGCSAKNALVNSAEGVYFVHKTLIYQITRQYQLEMSGLHLAGFWKRGVIDQSTIDASCATVNTRSRKLLFTLPAVGTDERITFAYNIPPNTQTPGGWTRYSNINANLWGDLSGTPIFATSSGFVGVMRADNTVSDYQDAGVAIQPKILFRAIDGGIPTSQKFMKFISLIAGSENTYQQGGITLSVSNNFSTNYVAMDSFALRGSEAAELSGLGDVSTNRLQITSFSPADPKAGWYQLKMEVSDGNFTGLYLSKVVYKIAALRTRAEVQAAQTR